MNLSILAPLVKGLLALAVAPAPAPDGLTHHLDAATKSRVIKGSFSDASRNTHE
jgi:hypothetical protein